MKTSGRDADRTAPGGKRTIRTGLLLRSAATLIIAGLCLPPALAGQSGTAQRSEVIAAALPEIVSIAREQGIRPGERPPDEAPARFSSWLHERLAAGESATFCVDLTRDRPCERPPRMLTVDRFTISDARITFRMEMTRAAPAPTSRRGRFVASYVFILVRRGDGWELEAVRLERISRAPGRRPGTGAEGAPG